MRSMLISDQFDFSSYFSQFWLKSGSFWHSGFIRDNHRFHMQTLSILNFLIFHLAPVKSLEIFIGLWDELKIVTESTSHQINHCTFLLSPLHTSFSRSFCILVPEITDFVKFVETSFSAPPDPKMHESASHHDRLRTCISQGHAFAKCMATACRASQSQAGQARFLIEIAQRRESNRSTTWAFSYFQQMIGRLLSYAIILDMSLHHLIVTKMMELLLSSR